MSDKKQSFDNASRHFAGVYFGLDGDKGKELIGVRLNGGTDVQVRVSATGKLTGIYVDGKKVN